MEQWWHLKAREGLESLGMSKNPVLDWFSDKRYIEKVSIDVFVIIHPATDMNTYFIDVSSGVWKSIDVNVFVLQLAFQIGSCIYYFIL